MANEKNLMPIETLNSRRTREEHSKDSQKGGQKSGEVRRQRKAMREQMELLLSLPTKNEEHRAFMQELGIDEDNMDNQMMLIMSLYSKALKGDTKAFELFRDTMEGKPVASKEEMSTEIEDIDETDEMIYGDN